MIHIVKEQTVQRTVGSLSTCRWSLQIKTGLEKCGGAKRDRTADLLRARQALSQLSYGPVDLHTSTIGGSGQIRTADLTLIRGAL